jgi:hypothetical protein
MVTSIHFSICGTMQGLWTSQWNFGFEGTMAQASMLITLFYPVTVLLNFMAAQNMMLTKWFTYYLHKTDSF